MDFSACSELSDEFPSGGVQALEDEGFDSLPAFLSADRYDTDGLKLKKVHVREATKTRLNMEKALTVLLYRQGLGDAQAQPQPQTGYGVPSLSLIHISEPTRRA